jgi:hypothetical protein
LRAAAGVELRHDVVQHVLHGAFRVGELQGDLAGRMAGRDQRQNLLLAVRQPCRGRLWLVVLGQLGQQVLEQAGRDDARPVRRRPHRGGERLGGQLVLAQIADRTRLQSGKRRVLAGLRRAHDHPGADGLTHALHEVRPAGQRGVDEDEVGLEERRVLPRVAHPLGIGDRLDLLEEVQTRHQSSAVDRVGVEDEELHP